jgi:murein endopeptidase
MGRVPRLAAVLLSVLALAVLGGSVALAQELGDPPAPAPVAPVTPPPTVVPPAPEAPPQDANGPPPETVVPVRWRASRAAGLPYAGRLVHGVELPESGRDYFTWDSVLKSSPSRAWRRWGTDDLIRTLLDVLAEYRAAHPEAPRVGIGDLSRPRGGVFDQRYGGLGHASHQNGLDADVYYPRSDGTERRPFRPSQVDSVLAQDLVDRFAAAGAQYVFVGPRLSLTGPRRVVSELAHHDDHLHVRLRAPRR